MFKFPAWTIPASCFNNTTALPLLLLQSLEMAGILNGLEMGPDDTSSAALRRAQSYFLVSAVVGNCLTFAVGPKLLDDEEAPDKDKEELKKVDNQRQINGHAESDEELANPRNSRGRTAEQEEEHVNETTTLLPDSIASRSSALVQEAQVAADKKWVRLPSIVQKSLDFIGSLLNAPLLGAIVGATIGLAPPLHRAFFNQPSDGGIFKAWLTASVKNIGDLFPALQLVVVGAKLSGSLVRMKKGEASGSVKLVPMLSVFFIRFILWPA